MQSSVPYEALAAGYRPGNPFLRSRIWFILLSQPPDVL